MRLAAGDLYEEHWEYVVALLLSHGIPRQDAGDVAQTVWMQVHRRRDSYDETRHRTPRAWLTGFVARCAANHRRTQRRRALTLIGGPDEQLPAPGLTPEQDAILLDVHRLIPDGDQRVALLLQVRHGLSIAEIAAVQGVTESAVERRLHMARKALKSGDDDRKASAFLGFGSLEALAEALKPRPIPPEVGERQWQRIAERIRQEEAASGDTDPEPPSSSFPPAEALPAPASPSGPVLVALGKAKLVGLLFVVFLSGAGAGIGGLLAWPAHGAAPYGDVTPARDGVAVVMTVAPSTSVSSTAPGAVPVASAAPSTSARATASSSVPVVNEAESQRLLAQMRRAMSGHRFSEVLALAEQHARQLGAVNVREREALRIEALRRTGRNDDAEQRARAVVRAHPEHRAAMERAAGHTLP